MGCLVFMGWVISLANEWEDYSNYLEKGRDFQELGHFLAFYGRPWNCHGTSGCVILLPKVGSGWAACLSKANTRGAMLVKRKVYFISEADNEGGGLRGRLLPKGQPPPPSVGKSFFFFKLYFFGNFSLFFLLVR